MPKTRSMRSSKNRTVSRRSNASFDKEITVYFLEMLMMVKLFHWKTHSFATHKATDELYESLNEHIDSFIEVLLGKTGTRINLTQKRSISLVDLNSQASLKARIEQFKKYLVSLNTNKAVTAMTDTDLLNIRDEILGDLNKFLYLLTFK
jgi:DNA-binding ferritin-like protein